MEPPNIDTIHPLDAHSARLKDDLLDARRKIDDLEHQVTRYREDFERQRTDLSRQAANFERDLQEARVERESFRRIAEEKTLEINQLRHEKAELERLQKECVKKQKEVDSFRQRCSTQEKELEGLRTTNAELKAEVSAVREKELCGEKARPGQLSAKKDAQNAHAARSVQVIELSSDDDENVNQGRMQYPSSSRPPGRTGIAGCLTSSVSAVPSEKSTQATPSTVLSTPDQRASTRTGFALPTPLPTPSVPIPQRPGAPSKKRRFPSIDPPPVKVNNKRPRLESASDSRGNRLIGERLPQPEDIIQMRKKPEGQENHSPVEGNIPTRSQKGKEKEIDKSSPSDSTCEKNPLANRTSGLIRGPRLRKASAATDDSTSARKTARKDTPVLYVPTYIKDIPNTLNARVASYASFKADIPALPTLASTSPQRYPGYVHRHFLSSQYGASPQTWLAQITPARNVPRRERRIVFSQWANNPGLPTQPGQPGTIIANRLEILERPPWSIFVRAPTESLWQYRGEYIASLSDTPISGEEFRALPDTVRVQWAKVILEPQKWRCYMSMRARIWLRKMGFPLDDETVEETICQNKRTYLQNLREEDILRALDNGEEELNVLLLKPVGYDTDFQMDMQLNYAKWLRGKKKVTAATNPSTKPAPNEKTPRTDVAGGLVLPTSSEAGPSTRRASTTTSDRVLRQPGQGGKPMDFVGDFEGDSTDMSEGDPDDGSDYTELD